MQSQDSWKPLGAYKLQFKKTKKPLRTIELGFEGVGMGGLVLWFDAECLRDILQIIVVANTLLGEEPQILDSHPNWYAIL
jgi:hypothetical protein